VLNRILKQECTSGNFYIQVLRIISAFTYVLQSSLRSLEITEAEAFSPCQTYHTTDHHFRSRLSDCASWREIQNLLVEMIGETNEASVLDSILEVLCAMTLSSHDSFRARFVELHFTCINAIYNHSIVHERNAPLPLAYRIILMSIPEDYTSLTTPTVDQVINNALLRISRALDQASEHALHLCRSLTRHFGLLLSFDCSSLQCIHHISSLTDTLVNFVISLGKVVGTHNQPPKKNLKSLPTLPGLDGSTFTIVYDMILHFVVARAGLLKVASDLNDASKKCGPYSEFVALTKIFQNLIDLYGKSFLVFPQSAISAVTSAANCILDICGWKVHEFIDWRNSQPLPLHTSQHAYDPGSLRFFKQALQAVAKHSSGAIFQLVRTVSALDAAPSVMAKLVKLERKARKTFQTYNEVASAHNFPTLTPDNIEGNPQEEDKLQQGVVAEARYNQPNKDYPSNDMCISDKASSTVNVEDFKQLDGTEHNEDLDSIKDEDMSDDALFLAKGKWGPQSMGGNDDDGDNDDDSDQSLTLQSSVMKVIT
jgi:hypothetical protein